VQAEGLAKIAPDLIRNTTLESLKAARAGLADEGMEIMGEIFHHTCSLRELDIRDNHITDRGIISLSQALRHNSTLTQLEMSSNNMGPSGAISLADALRYNSTLKYLDLGKCNMDDRTMLILSQALCHNVGLKELVVSQIPPYGVEITKSFCAAIGSNCGLKIADLFEFRFDDTCVEDIKSMVSTNTTLETLCIGRWACQKAIDAIFEGLLHNTTLHKLHLYNIGPDNVPKFISMLEYNSTLMYVGTGHPGVSQQSAVTAGYNARLPYFGFGHPYFGFQTLDISLEQAHMIAERLQRNKDNYPKRTQSLYEILFVALLL
jgi:hypothetical protein